MLGKVVCLIFMVALIVGCLVVSVLKVGLAGAAKRKMGDFMFWIESDAWRVYLCFKSINNTYILWN